MKRPTRLFGAAFTTLFLMGSLVACRQVAEAPTPARVVRVAAVGNSITFGAGIEDRARDSYPAQLGRLLGKGYDVRNFGVSGRTMLKKGDYPYWAEDAFAAAKAFEPDVVVIMLGTNDTKPQNWQYRDDFMADYEAMIDAFAALSSKPKIWICYPPPAFAVQWGIREAVIAGEVMPMIDRIAREKGVSVIDVHAVLEGRGDLFPDAIHPGAEGAGVMAAAVAEALTRG